MRTLMTFATLCAAGAGYIYLQPSPAAGDLGSTRSSAPSLFDWKGDAAAKGDTARVPVNELVNRIHEHTRSVLDDFANQHGGQSDAHVENAFERLRQVTQSSRTSSSDQAVSSRDGSDWITPSRVPMPNADDLQRIAFDPATSIEPIAEAVPEDRTAVKTEPPVKADSPPAGIAPTTVATEPVAPLTVVERLAPITPAETPRVEAVSSDPASSIAATTTPPPAAPVATVAPSQPSQAAPAQPNGRVPVRTNDLVTGDAVGSRVSKIGNKDQAKRTVAPATKRETMWVKPEWRVIGKTTEGRPMHSMYLGTPGATRTLVIAGLNGDDRTAVRWLELLAEETARHPEFLSTNEVVFFRAGNPDGLVRNVKENVRGVPLNRNFPSRRYRPMFNTSSTAAPASELETRVMLETFYSFRPRRVIHLTATTARSQVLFNRAADRAAHEFERATKITPALLDAEQLPGSVEDFSDGTLDAAMLSLRLNVGDDWQKAWNSFQPHVLAAVVGQSLDANSKEFDPDRSPIPNANIEPISTRPNRRGYEELPAPPQ